MPRVFLSLALLASSGCTAAPEPQPIFNGLDLTGWRCERPACWTVEAGVLHARNDPEQKGDVLWTERGDYRDYTVQLDFRFGTGRIDSGIFLGDTTQQIQIGDSGSMKRDMTALPYVAGKGYPVQVETAQTVLRRDDWNTLRIELAGSACTTWLNGREIMTYRSDALARSGPIGIQVHPQREMSLSFRNIVVTEHPHDRR
jgi:hypothetical protein